MHRFLGCLLLLCGITQLQARGTTVVAADSNELSQEYWLENEQDEYAQEEDPIDIEFQTNLSFDNNISKNNKTGLIFQILILTSNQVLDPSYTKNIKPVFIERTIDLQDYSYFAGSFRTLEAAKLAKRELQALGYPEAKIHAYLDGVKIPLFKVQELLQKEILMSSEVYNSLINYELGYYNKQTDANSLSYTDINFNTEGRYSKAKNQYAKDVQLKGNQRDADYDYFYAWWAKRANWYKKNPHWRFSGDLRFDFSKQEVQDWTAGGDNFTSLITNNRFNANYQKGIIKWDTYIIERLVYMKVEDEEFRKSDERFEFNSNLGVEAIGSWFYELKFNLVSQLFPSFDRKKPEIKLHDILSPGDLTFALGLEYDLGAKFSLLLSPLTFRSRMVLLTEEIDPQKYGLDEGQTIDLNFGSSSELKFSVNITPSFNIRGRALIFSDYVKNIDNIDLDSELIATYKINNFFSIQFSNYAIYQENTNVNRIKGKPKKDGFRRGFQTKEYFTIGLSYHL